MNIDLKTIENEINLFFENKKFDKKTIGNTNCFVHYKNKSKIFRVALDDFDISEEMNQFLKEYNEYSGGKLEVINILISYKKDVSDSAIIVIGSLEEANTKLKQFFPKINLKVKEAVEEEISEAEIMEQDPQRLIAEMKNPALSKNKDLQKIAKNMQNPHIVARICGFIFVFCPLIIAFISLYLVSYRHESLLQDSSTANFFFGAVDFKLTIYLQQYWRILTYALIPDFGDRLNGFLELIVCGIVLFGVLKYCFSLIGVVKFAVVSLSTYLIVGFFAAFFIQNGSLSGQTIPLAIATGSLCLTIWTNSTNAFVKMFTKNRIFIPIVVLILIPIIENSVATKTPIILLAFCVSAALLYLVNYDWKAKQKDISLYLALLIVAGSIITPFVLAFCYTPVPAKDQSILNAIALMYKYSLASKLKAESWIYDLFKVHYDLRK
ncbi:hypothetical protein [Spiroplasma endosymbiont of Crioceris asparagi]|uniref:hypothetical protein n=1 Tax=Spiroplasma endosymbiont of Crioceris asparagi TaxID=3066286 RepID=UPI0030D576B9